MPGELAIKAMARERDGYACVKCGMTDTDHRLKYGRQIQVHRLVPGSDYSVDGCETVCELCHAREQKRPPSGIKASKRPEVVRLEVFLPPELVAGLDRRAGPGGRTAYIVRHLARVAGMKFEAKRRGRPRGKKT